MKAITHVENWLKNEGFRCEWDDDGDLRFKYQGCTLVCDNDKNDEQFLRIVLPNIYKIENDRLKVLEAMNTVNSEIKVLKAFVHKDLLCLAIELFLDSKPNVEDFLERCLNILLEGRNMIAEEIFK